jgi:hypothetical protein
MVRFEENLQELRRVKTELTRLESEGNTRQHYCDLRRYYKRLKRERNEAFQHYVRRERENG